MNQTTHDKGHQSRGAMERQFSPALEEQGQWGQKHPLMLSIYSFYL